MPDQWVLVLDRKCKKYTIDLPTTKIVLKNKFIFLHKQFYPLIYYYWNLKYTQLLNNICYFKRLINICYFMFLRATIELAKKAAIRVVLFVMVVHTPMGKLHGCLARVSRAVVFMVGNHHWKRNLARKGNLGRTLNCGYRRRNYGRTFDGW